MARGRKRMPAKIHKLHGTHRDDRHGEEIRVESILPDPPEWLDDIARGEWLRISKELHGLGLLSALDLVALEMYCVVYSRWLTAEKKVKLRKGAGAISKTPNGYQQQSAWLQIANTSIKQLQSLAAEFGLTPATRARLKMIEKQPKQLDLLELLEEASKSKAANG